MPRFPRMLTSLDSTPVADPPEAVNVESDFVVILAALLCALICVVGLIAVARCAWLRRGSGGSTSRSTSQAAAVANKGLKKKIVQSLPKFTYGATAAGGGSSCKFASTECAICLGEFAEGDEVRILPQCGHGFHVGCIDTWLGSHSSCPSCRQILVVARCQKCGQFPAISSGRGGPAAETNCKGREDNNNNNNNNNNSNQNHNVIVGFLP
ncbi:hypothetical protein JCGZ_22415 [Jatropha curcas]|uniref:RING-type domain-containing protein n=1 Tax=Jatropha curcas TaxID=180498 RepID=A0A067L9A2_JATCU|nr:RING-H2 finger protein ATL8 [Jatropha curcas]KDP43788.1 hypothetical protein JCGZ_22415 [Jatropha curcas]